MIHVLLIEDDARIREIVDQGLGTRGFTVSMAEDGETGRELAEKLPSVDLVLLDLMLPGMSGLQTLRAIREIRPSLPVIALTALDDLDSKVHGLDAGADDYVTKPFSIEELGARIRARLRWREEGMTMLRVGELTVDLASQRAFLDDQEIPLSARELSLLVTFMRHQGQVLSQPQLLELVWDIGFDPGSNVVEVYVAALRRKLSPDLIETVRGSGYRFVGHRREEDGG